MNPTSQRIVKTIRDKHILGSLDEQISKAVELSPTTFRIQERNIQREAISLAIGAKHSTKVTLEDRRTNDLRRCGDILEAMKQLVAQGDVPPEEWVVELNEKLEGIRK